MHLIMSTCKFVLNMCNLSAHAQDLRGKQDGGGKID